VQNGYVPLILPSLKLHVLISTEFQIAESQILKIWFQSAGNSILGFSYQFCAYNLATL